MKSFTKGAITFALILTWIGALFMTGCSSKDSGEALKVTKLACIHEQEFGGVYIKMTIDDFDAVGFNYGDSVDIVFSNGTP